MVSPESKVLHAIEMLPIPVLYFVHMIVTTALLDLLTLHLATKQWGIFRNKYCGFPMAFPNAVFSVVHIPIDAHFGQFSSDNFNVTNLNNYGFSHGDVDCNHFFFASGI